MLDYWLLFNFYGNLSFFDVSLEVLVSVWYVGRVEVNVVWELFVWVFLIWLVTYEGFLVVVKVLVFLGR